MKKTVFFGALFAVALCFMIFAPAPAALADDANISYTLSPKALSGAGSVALEVSMSCEENAADLLENAVVSFGGAQVISLGNVQPGSTVKRSANLSIATDQLDKDLKFTVSWSQGGKSQEKSFSFKVSSSTQEPAVDFSASAPAYSATEGETINFTYTVKNTGKVTLSSLKVTDFGKEIGTKTSLKAGGTQTFTYKLKVTGDMESQPKLTYTAGGKSYNVTLDLKSVTITRPQATVTISTDQTQIKAGDKVTLLYTIKNTGNVALGAITIYDGDTNENLYNAESLAKGATRTFQRTVTVETSDTYSCVLSTTAGGQETKLQSNQLELQVIDQTPVYDLGIAVTANPAELAAPGEIEFTIAVTNYGTVPVENVIITDTMGNVISNIASLNVGTQNISYKLQAQESAKYVFNIVVNAGLANEQTIKSGEVTVNLAVSPTAEPGEGDAGKSNRLSGVLILIVVVAVLLVAALAVLLTLMLREKNKTKRISAQRRDERNYRDRRR
ncbi:MAG: hypothetical protein PHD32_11575 [Eubacteriales bacterium]|nr:hypothetical protein [Eubacteriales bacterium]